MRRLLGRAINAGVLLRQPYLLPAVQVRYVWNQFVRVVGAAAQRRLRQRTVAKTSSASASSRSRT